MLFHLLPEFRLGLKFSLNLDMGLEHVAHAELESLPCRGDPRGVLRGDGCSRAMTNSYINRQRTQGGAINTISIVREHMRVSQRFKSRSLARGHIVRADDKETEQHHTVPASEAHCQESSGIRYNTQQAPQQDTQ